MEVDEGDVRAARAGDGAALRRLVGAAWPYAYRAAWSVVRDRAAAEDAAQEACARLVVGIGGLRRPDAFRTWLYRLAVNAAIQEMRRTSRRRAVEAAEEVEAAESDVAGQVDLRRAMAELDPSLRLPLVLHYHAGLTSAEIGRVLGLRPATVRFRLMRARECLRQALAAEPSAPGEENVRPQAPPSSALSPDGGDWA
ncbi:MAG: sigma-70 family RNA polymerase sigma factor [Firmicutes bacterium]|nr:sigma-70 family RNA polymerase sigma factor [Bacillota bacterium]